MSRIVAAITLCLAATCAMSCAQDTPAIETTYFLGESKMSLPDGKHLGTSLSLVKRIVNPAASKIEEHVVSISEKEAKLFVVFMEVKGNKFTMTEKSKAFTGEGDLIGEPWKWKGWKSVSKLANGAGTWTSDDKHTEQGLSVRKTFTVADGTVKLIIEDSLQPITPKTYELLHLRLIPLKAK
jgi:hypothetical protein